MVSDKIRNKSVILVGNSVELLEYEYGDYIESFDIIVRFGRGIPYPDIYKSVGQRTDIWITGFLRANAYHNFPTALKLLNRCRIHLDKKPNREIIFDHEVMYSDDELKLIFKEFGCKNGDANALRPSAGYMGIHYFVNKMNVWKDLNLIGFDFFQKKIPWQVGQDYPSSWHLPENTIQRSPHAKDKEREIVSQWNEKGILNWKILSDLKEGLIDFS